MKILTLGRCLNQLKKTLLIQILARKEAKRKERKQMRRKSEFNNV